MVKFSQAYFFGTVGLFLCLISCKSEEKARHELFYPIFKNDSATFRGTNPGDDITIAQKNEFPTPPKDVNTLGITYEYTLSEGQQLFVEYYKDQDDNDNTDRITSIIANVYLKDEITTINLYDDIEDYFNTIESYILTRGSYGDYLWESKTEGNNQMEIHLKLEDNKTGITLMFLDTRIGP